MERKLALYSDQVIPENKKVDLAMIELIGKTNPKIGYIPSCSDPTRKYYKGEGKYKEKVDYYAQYGIKNLLYFDLDTEYDQSKIPDLMKCDAIHLSGGNTYYFLHLLKKRGFIKRLREFVENGGVLIGISAGAILMSKTINITTLYKTDTDDNNFIGLKDFSSLGLVDFEFFPHFNQKAEYLELIRQYSKTTDSVIYACSDGDGIIVDGEKISLIGNISRF